MTHYQTGQKRLSELKLVKFATVKIAKIATGLKLFPTVVLSVVPTGSQTQDPQI